MPVCACQQGGIGGLPSVPVEVTVPECVDQLNDRSLYVCHGNKCNLLASTDGLQVSMSIVAALTCSQEEAGARLFLHARHAAENGASTIIIRSPDVDVTVLGCVSSPAPPAHWDEAMQSLCELDGRHDRGALW